MPQNFLNRVNSLKGGCFGGVKCSDALASSPYVLQCSRAVEARDPAPGAGPNIIWRTWSGAKHAPYLAQVRRRHPLSAILSRSSTSRSAGFCRSPRRGIMPTPLPRRSGQAAGTGSARCRPRSRSGGYTRRTSGSMAPARPGDNSDLRRARTIEIALALNLVPCFTPVGSPESNSMAEAFVEPGTMHCRGILQGDPLSTAIILISH